MFDKKSMFKIAIIAISATKLVAMILIAAGLLTSCNISIGGFKGVIASDNIISKNISDAVFSEIEVLGPHVVEYSQSADNKCKVSVTGPDNIVELLSIRIENGVLRISYKENTNISLNNKKLTVFASSPSISKAELKGSGDIIFKTPILCEDLKLFLKGSGNIVVQNIRCKELYADMAGSGDIIFNSQTLAENTRLELKGSGNIKVKDLSTKTTKAVMKGSGDIEIDRVLTNDIYTSLAGSGEVKIKDITATGLDASLSGSGDMYLSGNVDSCALNLKSSGTINAENLRSDNCIADLSGSGHISCHAVNTIASQIQGSGNITVTGNPKNVKTTGKKTPTFKN